MIMTQGIHFICSNVDCVGHGQEVVHGGKMTYVMKDGRLVPKNIPKCPRCDQECSWVDVRPDKIPNFAIGEFKGMSIEKKTELLRKRMYDNNKKDGAAEKKEFYRKKAIEKFIGG